MIDKEVRVSTMLISDPKTWKWPEKCDKTHYELNKIKHIPANILFLTNHKYYKIKEVNK